MLRGRHAAALVAPTEVEYVVPPHIRHTFDTVPAIVVEYVPATQLVHVDDAAMEYDPALHARH